MGDGAERHLHGEFAQLAGKDKRSKNLAALKKNLTIFEEKLKEFNENLENISTNR